MTNLVELVLGRLKRDFRRIFKREDHGGSGNEEPTAKTSRKRRGGIDFKVKLDG